MPKKANNDIFLLGQCTPECLLIQHNTILAFLDCLNFIGFFGLICLIILNSSSLLIINYQSSFSVLSSIRKTKWRQINNEKEQRTIEIFDLTRSISFFFHLFFNLNILDLWPLGNRVFQNFAGLRSDFEINSNLVVIFKIILVSFILSLKGNFELLSHLLGIDTLKFFLNIESVYFHWLFHKDAHHVINSIRFRTLLWGRFQVFNDLQTLRYEFILVPVSIFGPFLNFLLCKLAHGDVPVVKIEVFLFRGNSYTYFIFTLTCFQFLINQSIWTSWQWLFA